mgnify:FL=1
MPTYEYRCLKCSKRFDVRMSYSDYGNKEILCPHCGGSRVTRKIGRIRIAKSDESRLESMADPAALAGIEDDPRAMGKMMRQMSSQMGEDMGPEFNEVVSRLERGDSPDTIEKDIPDLGMDDSGGVGGGFDDSDF